MQPGDRIENYVLIEQIGQGGQAAVWSAEDEQLRRTVAIKTIDLMAPVAGEGTAVTIAAHEQAQRFRSEAKIIAELEHPFILPIYSFGQQGNWLYIVMRYMAGGTLRSLIQKRPLEPARLLKLAEPIADALGLAHQHRIIHRDIKSVNILLDAQQRPYLADFGLSVTAGAPDSQSGSGTLAYMSPEQLKGAPIDQRSDIYAFGILLYEMLTGDVPRIAGGGHWNLAQLMAMTPLPVPPSIPEPLANVLRRATAFDPEARYEHITALIEDLRAAEPGAAPVETEEASTVLLLPVNDPAARASVEAGRLFETALEKWADGAGRFRFYEEDFKYVDSFYNVGEELGIHLDDAARRMMLRGALEYGHNLDHWWSEVNSTAERRAVTLQTLTSELPTARLRAIRYLTALEDSTPPAIPIRVAAIIGKDPDAEVRLAGVKLLEQRVSPAAAWRQVAYNTTIDSTLASLASHDSDPRVAEAAARACGRIYSTLAVAQLAEEAGKGQAQALQALIFVRDEVPGFPRGVPFELRRRVFAALTRRQFFQPGLLARYASAVLAFAAGWVPITYWQWGTPETRARLSQEATINIVGSGVLYGLLVGLAVLLAVEPAQRLRAWSRVGRIALSLLMGGLVSLVMFYLLRRYYYYDHDPIDSWPWLIGPAVLFITGFALSSGLTRRPWLRALIGAAGVLAAIYSSWLSYEAEQTFVPLIFFKLEQPNQPLILSTWLALTMGILTFLPEWLRRRH